MRARLTLPLSPGADGLLSDLRQYDSMAVGLPPRVIEPALLRGMKQARSGC